MYKIIFQEDAVEQIQDIYAFISQDSKSMWIQVIQKIIDTLENLENFPYLGKIYDWEIRMFVESKYKFKILYTFSNNTVEIISVFKHQNY